MINYTVQSNKLYKIIKNNPALRDDDYNNLKQYSSLYDLILFKNRLNGPRFRNRIAFLNVWCFRN